MCTLETITTFPTPAKSHCPETGMALRKAPISIDFKSHHEKTEFGVFNQFVIFQPRFCCLCAPVLTRETGAQRGLFTSYTGICHLLFSNLKLLQKNHFKVPASTKYQV